MRFELVSTNKRGLYALENAYNKGAKDSKDVFGMFYKNVTDNRTGQKTQICGIQLTASISEYYRVKQYIERSIPDRGIICKCGWT